MLGRFHASVHLLLHLPSFPFHPVDEELVVTLLGVGMHHVTIAVAEEHNGLVDMVLVVTAELVGKGVDKRVFFITSQHIELVDDALCGEERHLLGHEVVVPRLLHGEETGCTSPVGSHLNRL